MSTRWARVFALAAVLVSTASMFSVSPAVAAASPRLALRPARVVPDDIVEVQLSHCDAPRLFASSDGKVNAGDGAGYVQVTDGALNPVDYLAAEGWSPSRSNWTTSFVASLPSGEYFVRVACGSSSLIVGSRLTVR